MKHSGNTDEHITDLVLELGIGENHREKWHLSMAVKAREIFIQVEKMDKEWRQQHATTLNYVHSALGNDQSSGL